MNIVVAKEIASTSSFLEKFFRFENFSSSGQFCWSDN